jgi:hypothetical protein
MHRISRDGREPITDLNGVDQLEPAIRSGAPGRYHVDEIRTDPFPSGHTSRAWGKLIWHTDGRIEVEQGSLGGPC